MKKELLVLCILDGLGYREDEKYNAVQQAKTSTLDMLTSIYPSALLRASGLDVGLPHGQMGNSEVGHAALGLGRVVMQDLPKINQAIENGLLNSCQGLRRIVNVLKKSGGRCHLWGLLSDGGIHSHIGHLCALIDILINNDIPVTIHGCLDGRDTSPKSAIRYIDIVENHFTNYFGERLRWGTVGGRYFGMDRDQRWERIAKAYDAMVNPTEFAKDIKQYIQDCYQTGVTDEFIEPVAIENYQGMADNDGFISFNYRADRARQMMSVLAGDIDDFIFEHRRPPQLSVISTMTEYGKELSKKNIVLFPHKYESNSLGEVLSQAGLRQLRAAETEKYPHVTFFFNGGIEKAFPLEERIMIASPKVSTYDLQPEMSAKKLTKAVINKLSDDKIDVCIINFANGDMVGHTGNMNAAILAVECVDSCVGHLYNFVRSKKGHLLVTADHGNAEIMFDEKKKQPHTAHTTNDVIFILASDRYKNAELHEERGLQDVAPTILQILSIDKPPEMAGCGLIK